MSRSLAALFVMLASMRSPANAATLDGTFALQSGSARTTARLEVEPGSSALARRLTIATFARGARPPIVRYDVDMTKLLHLVIVSDDFRTFLHVHPVLGGDGRFRIEQSFPRAALYHVYADTMPHGLGQQVFRFDVPIGTGVLAPERDARPSGTSVAIDGYDVVLSSTHLRAGGESQLGVRVLRNGRLASGMQTYLGAAAHAVFLNARDLTYVHVHPLPAGAHGGDMNMSMPGMSMSDTTMGTASPDMRLHVAIREPGTYALWLQFRAGGDVHVARFVVSAR